MAGYSGTPLAKKLGILPGHRVRLSGHPAWIEPVVTDSGGILSHLPPVELALVFATSMDGVQQALEGIASGVVLDGALWLAWPKKASKVPTDITEDRLRDRLLPTGWVDNKVCAIDETWSGLRMVRRLALRAALRSG